MVNVLMTKHLNTALINGNLIPLTEAMLPLTHSIFLTSLGVYESIKVDQGRPFGLTEHLDRLCMSAAMLDIVLPAADTILTQWANILIEALPPETYSLQILAIGSSNKPDEPTVVFSPKPLSTYPRHFYTEGAGAITYEGQRILPQCKSMNTLVNHLARTEAHSQGALEAILTHNNYLFEGARSNLFIVDADTNQLITAPDDDVLAGVTRDTIEDVMSETPYPVQKMAIPRNLAISEMFITATSMHVIPITVLDGHPIGDGSVGPVTQLAMARFADYYQRQISRYA